MSLTGGHARRISLMSQRSHSDLEAGAPNARYFHHKRGSIANVLVSGVHIVYITISMTVYYYSVDVCTVHGVVVFYPIYCGDTLSGCAQIMNTASIWNHAGVLGVAMVNRLMQGDEYYWLVWYGTRRTNMICCDDRLFPLCL